MDHFVSKLSLTRRHRSAILFWGVLLFSHGSWHSVLFVDPPPPLGAPLQWSIRSMQSLIGLSEAAVRVTASIVLRGTGMGILGILVALALREVRIQYAIPLVLVLAVLLAIASLWINYRYFPIVPQIPARLGRRNPGGSDWAYAAS